VELSPFFAALDEQPAHRSSRLAEVDVSEWSEGFRFEGLAAVFGEEMVLPDYSESVEHGAFRKALAAGLNVPMFVEHSLKSDQIPLATTAAGTMRLEEVANGLKVTADVADTSLGRDLRVSVARGDIGGMSTGFVVGKGNAKVFRRNGRVHRAIQSFKKILDVSPTWDPAYGGTAGEFRSAALTAGYVPGSTESLQQLLMGGTQLEDGAETEEELEETVTPSGVGDRPLLTARTRRLFEITLGGDDLA
jgi:HK97 family phage prohead protease